MKKKILAFLMAACVAATSVPMDGAVYAAEVRMEQEAKDTEQETETVVTTTGETGTEIETETSEISENTEAEATERTETTESTEAAENTGAAETTEAAENTEAAETTEAAEETEAAEITESTEIVTTEEAEALSLNYILVGAAEVDVPGTQQIVASIGEEDTEVSNVVLTYQNQTTGYQTGAADAVDDLKLFTIAFTGEEQKGTYALTGITYETKEGKGEISLAGLDMSVVFGVGESVETNPDQLISEEDPSLSADDLDIDVITMDEKGNVLSENVSEDGLALAQNLKLSSDGKKVIVLDPGHDDTHTGAHQNGAA